MIMGAPLKPYAPTPYLGCLGMTLIAVIAGIVFMSQTRHQDTPGVQLTPQSAACTDETMAVPAVCVELLELPWCPAEDDATDGTAGPACFWKSPKGDIWYNDGDGTVHYK
jgi:hypothetical protein